MVLRDELTAPRTHWLSAEVESTICGRRALRVKGHVQTKLGRLPLIDHAVAQLAHACLKGLNVKKLATMHHVASILYGHARVPSDQGRAVNENVGRRVRKSGEHFRQRLIEIMCRARQQQDVGTGGFLQGTGKFKRIGEAALKSKLPSRLHRLRQIEYTPAKARRQIAVSAITIEKIANIATEIEKHTIAREQWAKIKKDRIIAHAQSSRN